MNNFDGLKLEEYLVPTHNFQSREHTTYHVHVSYAYILIIYLTYPLDAIRTTRILCKLQLQCP